MDVDAVTVGELLLLPLGQIEIMVVGGLLYNELKGGGRLIVMHDNKS